MTCKPINKGTSIAFGVAIGAAVGAATGHLAVWIAVGAAIGYALASDEQCGSAANPEAKPLPPSDGN